MDAVQEARAAAINAALLKRGPEEVTGEARRKLVAELTEILTGPTAAEPEIAPGKRARLDEISEALRRDAAAPVGVGHMTVVERRQLAGEAADILLGGTPPEAVRRPR